MQELHKMIWNIENTWNTLIRVFYRNSTGTPTPLKNGQERRLR